MTQTIDRVISGGYCVGCGLCAHQRPAEFTLDFTDQGMFQARALGAAEDRADDISPLCPMSGEGADETAIAAALYPEAALHPEIGRHAMQGVGWVTEGDYRASGSSGGLLSWLAVQMLETGKVAQVVQIAPEQGEGGQLFSYAVSTTPDQIRARAKSRYYPVHATDALAHIRDSAVPTLFVGLPCFVKMARKLADIEPDFGAHLTFTLGLVCGHLKSAAFADLLAWQCDVPPGQIDTCDFRHKVKGHPATSYGFTVSDTTGAPRKEAMMVDLLGRDWGQGMMKYKACDYCDDVLAECADIAVGDAWLPEWKDDWEGTNVFVARHPVIVDMLRSAQNRGAVFLQETPADTVAQSQRSGLRHRHEGLAHRLWQARQAGDWAPAKRIAPRKEPLAARRKVYDLRIRIRDESHAVFQAARAAGSFDLFRARMLPLTTALAKAGGPSLKNRIKNRIRRPAKAVLKALRLR